MIKKLGSFQSLTEFSMILGPKPCFPVLVWQDTKYFKIIISTTSIFELFKMLSLPTTLTKCLCKYYLAELVFVG